MATALNRKTAHAGHAVGGAAHPLAPFPRAGAWDGGLAAGGRGKAHVKESSAARAHEHGHCNEGRHEHSVFSPCFPRPLTSITAKGVAGVTHDGSSLQARSSSGSWPPVPPPPPPVAGRTAARQAHTRGKAKTPCSGHALGGGCIRVPCRGGVIGSARGAPPCPPLPCPPTSAPPSPPPRLTYGARRTAASRAVQQVLAAPHGHLGRPQQERRPQVLKRCSHGVGAAAPRRRPRARPCAYHPGAAARPAWPPSPQLRAARVLPVHGCGCAVAVAVLQGARV